MREREWETLTAPWARSDKWVRRRRVLLPSPLMLWPCYRCRLELVFITHQLVMWLLSHFDEAEAEAATKTGASSRAEREWVKFWAANSIYDRCRLMPLMPMLVPEVVVLFDCAYDQAVHTVYTPGLSIEHRCLAASLFSLCVLSWNRRGWKREREREHGQQLL